MLVTNNTNANRGLANTTNTNRGSAMPTNVGDAARLGVVPIQPKMNMK
jgi:hypothetical protein